MRFLVATNKEQVSSDMGHEKSEDSNHLYTPLESDDDEVNKFPTYKSGVGV